ncbi:Ig-like domain-containing protein [Sphingomonas donggukensis]|uniref:Ig-like domain-containing protein n=1 Tax=Sphingomonas donggukensis TaxID=2949093 RepID=A0ABY4TX43_9SPHN|nr:Ig-like domain-containing protein [Sphingomonas donggukensis]URW74878.1 Ig-like domain-containing protein [Sphingomonas donggukensis]
MIATDVTPTGASDPTGYSEAEARTRLSAGMLPIRESGLVGFTETTAPALPAASLMLTGAPAPLRYVEGDAPAHLFAGMTLTAPGSLKDVRIEVRGPLDTRDGATFVLASGGAGNPVRVDADNKVYWNDILVGRMFSGAMQSGYTLSILFTEDVTAAQATDVLHQITFATGETASFSTEVQLLVHPPAAPAIQNPLAGMDFGSDASIIVFDITGDGRPDLLIGSSTDQGLTILRNEGGGVFTTLPRDTGPLRDVVYGGFGRAGGVADLDGDGRLDIALVNFAGSFSRILNTANGFAYETLGPTANVQPFDHIAVAPGQTPTFFDIDGDGTADLILSNGSGTLGFYRLIAGHYEAAPELADRFTSTTGDGITFFDIDFDGDDDAIVTSAYGLRLFVNESGFFGEMGSGPDNPLYGYSVPVGGRITFFDVTGDGVAELLIAKTDGTIEALSLKLPVMATTELSVIGVNDIPTMRLGGGAQTNTAIAYTEGAAAKLIAPNATFIDDDWAYGAGAKTLTVRVGGNDAADQVGIQTGGRLSLQGGSILLDGIVIGTVASGLGSPALTIGLTAQSTVADVRALLQAFTYRNASDVPVTAARDIAFTITDAGGASSTSLAALSVTSINTPPSLTGLPSYFQVDEQAAPVLLLGSATIVDRTDRWDGAQFYVDRLSATDRVAVRHQGDAAGQVGVSGSTIRYGGVEVASVSGGAGTRATIVFNAAASQDAVQAVLSNVTYANIDPAPAGSHDIVVNFVDHDGADIGASSIEGVNGRAITIAIAATIDHVPFIDADGTTPGLNYETTFTDGSAPIRLFRSPGFVDVDGGTRTFTSVTIAVVGNAWAGDFFDIDRTALGDITVPHVVFLRGGVNIGEFSHSNNGLTLTFNAAATQADMLQILRAVTFEVASGSPLILDRTIAVTTRPPTGVGSTSYVTVHVVDRPPVMSLYNFGAGYTENVPVSIAGGAELNDTAPFTITSMTVTISRNASAEDRLIVAGGYATADGRILWGGVQVGTVTGGVGTTPLVLTFQNGFSSEFADDILRAIQFDILSENPSTATRELTVAVGYYGPFLNTGGGQAIETLTGTTSLTVTATIDRPAVIDLNASDGAAETGATSRYIELAAPTLVAPNPVVIDDDLPIVTGVSLTIAIRSGGTADDRLSLVANGTGAGQVSISGNTLSYGGVVVGTFTGGGVDPIAITFVDGTSKAAVAAIIGRVGFSNVSRDPVGGDRIIEIAGNFLQGESSTATATVTVIDLANTIIVDLFAIEDVAATGIDTGTSATYRPGSGAMAIAPAAGVTAPDIDVSHATITVAITGNAAVGDRLSLASAGNGNTMFWVDGSTLMYGTTVFGTITGGTDGVALTITTAGLADLALLGALNRSVSFSTTSDSVATRTITFSTSAPNAPSLSATASVAIASTPAPGVVLDLEPADGAAVTWIGQQLPRPQTGLLVAANAVVANPTEAGWHSVTLTIAADNPKPGDTLSIDGSRGAGYLTNGVAGATATNVVGTGTGGGNGTPLVLMLHSSDGAPLSMAGITALLQAVRFSGSTGVPEIGTRAFTYTLTTDTGSTSARAYVDVGMPPVLDLQPFDAAPQTGVSLTYVDRTAPKVIAPLGLIGDFEGGARSNLLTVQVTGNADPNDRLGIVEGDGGLGIIGVSGTSVLYNGVAFATFTGGANGMPLSFDFGPVGGESRAVNALLKAISFSNLSSHAGFGTRTVTFTTVFAESTGHPMTAAATITIGFNPDAQTILDLNAADGPGTLGSASTYVALGSPVAIAPAGAITDADTPGIRTTKLTVTIGANATGDDRLVVMAIGSGATAVTIANGTVSYGGTVVGTVSGGIGAAPMTIAFAGGGASLGVATAILHAIGFTSASDTPALPVRTFTAVAGFENGQFSVATGTVAVAYLPVAVADAATVAADTTAALAVLANDYDRDGPAPAIATVDGIAVAVGGTVTLASGALVVRQADGTLRYDPNGAYDALISPQMALATGSTAATQATDTFRYGVVGGNETTVTVTVIGADLPVAVADAAVVAEDATVVVAALANDFDYDGPAPAIARIGGSAAVVGQAVTIASGATVTLLADGTLRYDPNGRFDTLISAATKLATGTTLPDHAIDSFTYTLAGGVQGSVSVTVQGVDTPGGAVAAPDGATVAENATVAIDVLANDFSVGGPVPVLATINGAAATIGQAIALASGARVTLGADGRLLYDPNGKFNALITPEAKSATGSAQPTEATDTFKYTVAGGYEAIVTVRLYGVDGPQAPVGVADTAAVLENATVVIDVLANDSDSDGPAPSIARVNGVAAVAGQTVTIASGARVTLGADGRLTYDPNGRFDYLVAPQLNLNGTEQTQATDTFRYTLAGGVETLVTVTVTGAGAPVPAVAVPDYVAVQYGQSIIIRVLDNDYDLDGPAPTLVDVDGYDWWTEPGAKIIFPSGAVLVPQADGSIKYDLSMVNYPDGPPPSDTFHYYLAGGVVGTVYVTILAAGSYVAVEDIATVARDGSVTIDVLANDPLIDGRPPTIAQLNRTFVDVGVPMTLASGAQITLTADGRIRYDTHGAFAGIVAATTDVFHYTLAGGYEAKVTLNVLATNIVVDPLPPVAIADVATVAVNAAVAIDVLANDASVGTSRPIKVDGVSLTTGQTVVLASGAWVTLLPDGRLSYDPHGSFPGLVSPATGLLTGAVNTVAPDSFRYTLTGGTEAVVSVTITGIDGPNDILRGNALDNVLTGTAATNVFDIGQGGSDTVRSGGGSDVIFVGAALDTGDWIDGGSGTEDQLGLRGAYPDYVFGANNLIDIETLAILSGSDTRFGGLASDRFSYHLTTLDSNVAAGNQLSVNARTLLAGEDLTFDGSAETDGSFLIYGGAGRNVLIGGQGSDGFYMGAVLDALDRIDGGGGALDQVGLQGAYATRVTFAPDTIRNIELLAFLPGNDTRFSAAGTAPSYFDFKTDDGNVAAGRQLVVQANTLRAGETLIFDGSAETDGSFLFYAGFGSDILTGGQGSDGFYFGQSRFTATDRVDGQGGALDQIGLQGDYSGANALTFGADQIRGIDMIVLLSGADTRFGGGGMRFGYTLTMDDANAVGAAPMVVQANTLRADEVLVLDASRETATPYTIYSGAGADTITGGAGDDTIWGRGGGDMLRGGAGNDIFSYFATTDSFGTGADRDVILDFAHGDRIDASRIGFTTFIGSGTFTGAGQLRAVGSDSSWIIEGDLNGDGVADFSIAVTTTAGFAWGANDFGLAPTP